MPEHLKRFSFLSDRSFTSDISVVLFFFVLVLFWPDAASAAPSLGDMICNIGVNIAHFSPLINAIAFSAGAVLAFQGVLLMKKHTDNPNDSQIVKGVAHILAGAALASLPTVAATIVQTLHLTTTDAAGGIGCGHVNPTPGGGPVPLDQMMQNFVANIRNPIRIVLSVLCFIMGLTFIFRGLLRGSKIGSDPRAAAPQGIIVNLLVGGVLTTIGTMIPVMTETLLGTGTDNSFAGIIKWSTFVGTGVDTAMADKTVAAILRFIQIIGIIGFIRGWLIIKSSVEGSGQATIAQGLTHIIGGTMAFNIGVMIRLFDETFGTGLT